MTINDFLTKARKEKIDLSDYFDLCQFCNENELEFDSGASRLCVIFPKEKKVLKIPKSGCSIDYCAREIHNFKLAQEYKVEKVLLPIALLCEVNGCKVYCQPMYTSSMGDMNRKERDKLNEKIKDLPTSKITKKVQRGVFDGKWRSLDRYWTARMVQLYGKKFAMSFETWTHTAKVNDLHNSNIGWLDRKPIILDYAGYFENGNGVNPFDLSI